MSSTKYEDYAGFVTDESHFQLTRSDTISSISTNATAPNLLGPGRTVGLLFDRLGAHVEKFLNIGAHRRGLGPKAVGQEIRRLLRHNETTIVERHSGFAYQFTAKEEKALRKLCERLLKYARFVHKYIICALWLLLLLLKAQNPLHAISGTGRNHKSHD